MAGPEFDEKTKRTVAARVGNRCTICDLPTHGPNEKPDKATILGEAAHIRGKRPGAARYDPGMTDAERRHITNALWACGNCHGKFDKDYLYYSVEELHSLRAVAEDRARERQCRLSDSPTAPLLGRIEQRWCHETTNDQTYVRRANEIRQLNAWFNDPTIRAISLIGIGGAGKTALVGHWLKVDNKELIRNIRGLFYWSFYVEKDIDQFLLALINFLEDLGTDFGSKVDRADPLRMLEEMFPRLPSLLLLLDGLEVLQQAISEGRTYGSFIDAKLRDFIQMVAYATLPWLCISTSRFPITDLDYTPNATCLKIHRLEEQEGADVLYQNGVQGAVDDRQRVSRYLEGHPLALRIFAASIDREMRTTPYQHLRHVFDDAIESNPFLSKLFRLLDFYARTLDFSQRAAIQALSLFRSPVPQRTVAIIVAQLKANIPTSHGSSDVALLTELGRLVATGLVVRDRRDMTDVYACHPIVRDYFRRDLLSKGDARAAIDILTSRPDDLSIQGASNLEPVLLACEALLLSGDVAAAVELYVNRLQKGRVFLAHGLPTEGKRFYDTFERFAVEHPVPLARAQEREGWFSGRRTTNFDASYFRNGAILFDILLGELTDAEQLIAVQLKKTSGSRRAIIFNHQALLMFNRGDYLASIDLAKAAIRSTAQGYIQKGVAALIQAKAYYMQLKTLVLIGLDDEATKTSNALSYIADDLDSADGQILVELARIWLALPRNQSVCLDAAQRAVAMASRLNEEHLALEARLLAAHCYIVHQQPERLVGELVAGVYQRAVRQSYPYFMISAQIMREYHLYSLGKPCSRHVLQQAATLAAAGKMQGLQAEALWVQSLIEDSREMRSAIRRNAEQLIDRLSYTALPSMYPHFAVTPSPRK